MKTDRGLPTWTLLLALAAPLPALPARALDGFDDVSGEVCQALPADAPGEIEAAYAARDTSALDESACKRLCHDVRMACEDRARNIADCIADQNKRQAGVEDELCGEDKGCAADVKRARKDGDKDARQDAQQTRRECRDLESECVTSCGDGTLFPQA